MLLIYFPAAAPRIEYILEFIFTQGFNISFSTTTDITAFEKHTDEKINYSQHRLQDEFFIKAFPLLAEDFIKKIEIPVAEKYETKVLFPGNECDMGFDIFSAIFYMLSRYEEYLPFTADEYGRFKATGSLAYKNNFLQIPVVDKWMNLFKIILQKKFPSIKINTSHFKAIVTYDIDVAYKFKGRSFKRNAGATVKDFLKLDFKNIQSRIKTLCNKSKDPWDVYDYLHEIIVQNNLHSIFFFLLGDTSKHDRNISYKNPLLKKLVDTIKEFSEIGIHPSYTTSVFTQKILTEKERLEKIANKKIVKSRQHFLKFILPGTYNALTAAGITEDYSMGFPAMAGFRAGTCRPFYFYDLKNEKATRLKIFPVTLMEGSFINAQNLQPENILQQIFNLIDEVKNVNGTFISIWHNHTVSETAEYKAWKNIHDKMIQKIITVSADA